MRACPFSKAVSRRSVLAINSASVVSSAASRRFVLVASSATTCGSASSSRVSILARKASCHSGRSSRILTKSSIVCVTVIALASVAAEL